MWVFCKGMLVNLNQCCSMRIKASREADGETWFHIEARSPQELYDLCAYKTNLEAIERLEDYQKKLNRRL